MSVYRGYTQEELDAQYNLRARHPEHPSRFARWSQESATARRTLECELDLSYGETAPRSLDFFHARGPGPHPVLAFIHGGYWQAMDKADFGFVAPSFVEAGISVAVVNYTLAPATGIDGIVDENRAALAWLWRNAARFGGDPSRLFACGHSAGGHLTAMLLATHWKGFAGDLPPDLVKGGCAISGLYDLEPIRLSFLNQALAMDAATARAASPAHLPAPGLPLALSVGGEETEEFHRQQSELVRAWGNGSGTLDEIEMPGKDHFTIMDALAQPESPLHVATRRLVLSASPHV